MPSSINTHVQIKQVTGDTADRYQSDTKLCHCVIWGFRRDVAENCALLGYYAASSGDFLPTFWDNLSGRILSA